MARETTIRFNFQLESAKRTAAVLETPGITKGTTTVLNVANTDPGWAGGWLDAGNLLYISASGLPSLDGKLHMITASAVGTETVTIGTDTSGDTETPAAFGDVNVQGIQWSDICLTEFSPSPGAPGEIDVTTMCDVERVNLPGLSAPGTASFTGIFDYDDAGMQAMLAAKRDAAARFFVGTSRLGQVFVYHGVVSSFSPGPMTVEAALTFTGTFTLDESPYFYKTP